MIQEEFDHEDIKDAKKLLSDLGVKVEKADGRRISPNRTALEADVADMMTGLEKMDLMQDLKLEFTSLDWSKVPRVTQEEAGNTVSIAIILSTVEALLNQVQKDSCNNADSIGTLFDMMIRTNSYASTVAPSNSWHVSVNEKSGQCQAIR